MATPTSASRETASRYDQTFRESDETMVLIGAMNMRKHLRAGITTLCEHGARNRVGFILKEGLKRGYISGPRLLVSGRPITCTGGHFHMCNEIADGVEEIRRSVRRLVHEGADYIKVMASGGGTTGTIPGLASYSTEELQALVGEARQFHRLTVAHCRAKESMVRAVEAGIDLIEHVEFLEPDHVMRFDPKVAEMLAESGIWLSPTLQAWTNYPEMVRLRKLRDEGAMGAKEESSAHPSRATSGEAAGRNAADARLLPEGARGARHGLGSGQPRIRPLRLRPAVCWSNAALPQPKPSSRRPGSRPRRPVLPMRWGPSRSANLRTSSPLGAIRRQTWPPSATSGRFSKPGCAFNSQHRGRDRRMDVAEIREQIPGLRFGVYLNTGGVGQAPASVSQAITAGYQLMADGRLSPIDWYEAMSQGRL